MKQRVIGLCVAKIHDEECYLRIKQINEEARKHNCKLLVFDPGVILETEAHNISSDVLFMMNLRKLSGLILDTEYMEDEVFLSSVVEKAKEYGVPVVSINMEREDCVSVISDPADAFTQMLVHLIECHGCKKIDFILGKEEEKRSRELLEIYREVLERNGIVPEEKRIRYGGYDLNKTEKIADELLKVDKPDAIVCANDRMGIRVYHVLKENGYRVPEDVMIAGMMGNVRGEFHRPLLTTCKKDVKKMAEKTIECLLLMKEGKEPEKVQRIPASLRLADSCGCECTHEFDSIDQIRKMYALMDSKEALETFLYKMEADLLECPDMENSASVLTEYILEDMLICCRTQFMDDIFFEGEIGIDNSEEETFIVLADTRADAEDGKIVRLGDLIPGFAKELEKDSPMILLPLQYEHRNFGYIVFCLNQYDEYIHYVEKYGLKLNSVLGKFISDRRILFANNELLRANQSLEQLQIRDGLTGLYNSRGFLKELEAVRKHCILHQKKIGLLCVDLDRLGNINEVYGHLEGDIAIQTLAKMIRDSLPDSAICGRLGSDEFAVALFSVNDEEYAVKCLVRTLEQRVEQYNGISGKEYSLEINYGYYIVKADEELQMQSVVDEAMYKKRATKNNRRAAHFSEEGRNGVTIDEDERKLVKEIIEKNSFKYAFQPIVSAKTGEVYAYEALMRTDTQPAISPMVVLKYATMDQKLYEIERATLNNVLEIFDQKRNELTGKKIFINSIPGYHLDETDFAKLSKKYSSLFRDVVVEITEQMEMADAGIELLKSRSSLEGFEVAIDDFGSGYSNTSSLLRFLPNYVKIDRMLICGINEDSRRQHFVKNIIEFAHDNGFLALAEGVETSEELRAMIHMDADLIQGYYTAKPQFEIQASIPEEIKKEIINANAKGKDKAKKKMYVVNQEKEIVMMRLALEQYTGIIVAQPELTIVGNPDFDADMIIRMKDNSKSRITIRNLHLVGCDEIPCIEVGKNSELTLVVEESNFINVTGIRVPEGSVLKLEGPGELNVSVKGIDCYAIGNDPGTHFGQIISTLSGSLIVNAEGNRCIGIGGGIAGKDSLIHIHAGKVEVNVASMDGVGIGVMEGTVPVSLKETGLAVELRTTSGSGIGCVNGEQQVRIESASVMVNGSGNDVCGIGSAFECGGNIDIRQAKVVVSMNGHHVKLVGSKCGGLTITAGNSHISAIGEGNEVLGVGSMAEDASIETEFTTIDVNIHAGVPVGLGAKPEAMKFEGGSRNVKINE